MENQVEKILAFNLSRVYQYLKDPDIEFGIISACRNENSEKENATLSSNLYIDLRNSGAGIVKVKGGYLEKTDDGSTIQVEETSYIVRGLSKKQLFDLGRKYQQDSILWKDKDGCRYIYMNGSEGPLYTKLATQENAVKEYWTRLKKGDRKFVFLSEMIPNSIGRIATGKRDEYQKLDITGSFKNARFF